MSTAEHLPSVFSIFSTATYSPCARAHRQHFMGWHTPALAAQSGKGGGRAPRACASLKMFFLRSMMSSVSPCARRGLWDGLDIAERFYIISYEQRVALARSRDGWDMLSSSRVY